jgi:hypothetical protein
MQIQRRTRVVRRPRRTRLRTLVLEAAALAMAATMLSPSTPAHALDSTEGALAAGAEIRSSSDPTLQAVTAPGRPVHMQFLDSGKCADVPAYSTAGGLWLDQWTCVAQSNELWNFDYVGVSGGGPWYRIRSASSGLCMNVNRGSLSDGAAIIQYPCGAYGNEYFALRYNGNVPYPYYWLQAFESGRCVNVQGASKANGAKLIQYRCGYYPNEYVRLY